MSLAVQIMIKFTRPKYECRLLRLFTDGIGVFIVARTRLTRVIGEIIALNML